jgi:hypothetical protein
LKAGAFLQLRVVNPHDRPGRRPEIRIASCELQERDDIAPLAARRRVRDRAMPFEKQRGAKDAVADGLPRAASGIAGSMASRAATESSHSALSPPVFIGIGKLQSERFTLEHRQDRQQARSFLIRPCGHRFRQYSSLRSSRSRSGRRHRPSPRKSRFRLAICRAGSLGRRCVIQLGTTQPVALPSVTHKPGHWPGFFGLWPFPPSSFDMPTRFRSAAHSAVREQAQLSCAQNRLRQIRSVSRRGVDRTILQTGFQKARRQPGLFYCIPSSILALSAGKRASSKVPWIRVVRLSGTGKCRKGHYFLSKVPFGIRLA